MKLVHLILLDTNHDVNHIADTNIKKPHPLVVFTLLAITLTIYEINAQNCRWYIQIHVHIIVIANNNNHSILTTLISVEIIIV